MGDFKLVLVNFQDGIPILKYHASGSHMEIHISIIDLHTVGIWRGLSAYYIAYIGFCVS